MLSFGARALPPSFLSFSNACITRSRESSVSSPRKTPAKEPPKGFSVPTSVHKRTKRMKADEKKMQKIKALHPVTHETLRNNAPRNRVKVGIAFCYRELLHGNVSFNVSRNGWVAGTVASNSHNLIPRLTTAPPRFHISLACKLHSDSVHYEKATLNQNFISF